MRKHIAKALQARSKAVKNAIDRYNAAASFMSPPMPELSWEQVVEYAFLADFDILRDTRAEIRSRPWTRPAYRLAMDRYFKILRAREEIKRLNVEIPRVVTWIRDENRFLQGQEQELRETEGKSAEQAEKDLQMAVQVGLYRKRRGRFDDGHMQSFWRLAETPGFTGSLKPGMAVERKAARDALQERMHTVDGMDVDEVVVVHTTRENWREDEEDAYREGWEDYDGESMPVGSRDLDDEGEGEEAREAELSDLVYQISMVAVDGGSTGDT